jgi:hypothetical protein
VRFVLSTKPQTTTHLFVNGVDQSKENQLSRQGVKKETVSVFFVSLQGNPAKCGVLEDLLVLPLQHFWKVTQLAHWRSTALCMADIRLAADDAPQHTRKPLDSFRQTPIQSRVPESSVCASANGIGPWNVSRGSGNRLEKPVQQDSLLPHGNS